MKEELEMFVVYDGASDVHGVVVRRWVVADGKESADSMPCVFASSVEGAREGLARFRPGLVNIGRTEDDDPAIREVWI